MARIHQELGSVRGEIVTGGAMDRPIGAQSFFFGKDFFNDQIEALIWIFRFTVGVRFTKRTALERFYVFCGSMHSINLIDANPGGSAVAHHLKKPSGDRLKDLWIFGPDRTY